MDMQQIRKLKPKLKQFLKEFDDWLKAFNVRRLRSTDVRALCDAIHNAVVRL